MWTRLAGGRLKVFRSLVNWLAEFRIYRRDEKGRIVKEFDHLMDASRYVVMSGLEVARTEPPKYDREQYESFGVSDNEWMVG